MFFKHWLCLVYEIQITHCGLLFMCFKKAIFFNQLLFFS